MLFLCIILGEGTWASHYGVSVLSHVGLTDCPAGGGQKECNQDSGRGRKRRGRGGSGTNGEYTCFSSQIYLYEKHTKVSFPHFILCLLTLLTFYFLQTLLICFSVLLITYLLISISELASEKHTHVLVITVMFLYFHSCVRLTLLIFCALFGTQIHSSAHVGNYQMYSAFSYLSFFNQSINLIKYSIFFDVFSIRHWTKI